MKTKFAVITLLGVCVWIVLPIRPLYAVQDTIVAVVNDELITLQDLHEYLTTIYMQLTSSGKSQAEIEQTMRQYEQESLKRLIDDKLILGEAQRMQIMMREGVVQERIDAIRKQFPSNQAFLDSLLKDGMTVSDLKEKLSDQMKAKFVVDKQVKDKIFVNPHEVTDYYNTHIDYFLKPERLELASIFVPYDEDKAQATAIIEGIQEKLKQGTDFLAVASEHSKRPSVGGVAKGELLPEIENVVFSLNEGEISPPIETDSGIYLFRVDKKLPAEYAGLEEVKDRIYAAIHNIKYKEKFDEWVEKLRAKAYIEIIQTP